MRAGTLKPHKAVDAVFSKLTFPLIAFPKIDGVRGCYLNSSFTGRTLKTFKNPRLNLFQSEIYQGFDGELALGDWKREGLCGKTTGFCNSLAENTSADPLPDWWLFDFLTPETSNLPYATRLKMLHLRVQGLQKEYDLPNLKLVPYKVISSLPELEAYHADNINAGFEGTICRDPKAPHKSGRSTVNQSWFTRLKDCQDEEAVVLGIKEAETNYNPAELNELGETERSSHQENKLGNSMVGSLICEIPDGRVITIGAGKLTHEERSHYFDYPEEMIGRTVKYRYMVHGELKMRRHPRFLSFRDEDI